MNTSLLQGLLILPGNVTVVMPALILWLTHGSGWPWAVAGPASLAFWLALVLFALGLTLMISTVTLFVRIGRGTPAPWDPPLRLVIRGVYRHVRNPMISGVIFVLLGEALVFQSWPLGCWAFFFIAANAFYIPVFEEPGLAKRFGPDYQTYKHNVPRWIPRLRPWQPPDRS